MNRNEPYRTRTPIAQYALDQIKSEREWESLDAARIGGRGATVVDFSDLDYASDREIVNQFLDRQALLEAYQDERR